MRKRTSRIYPDGITECNEVYAPFSDGWQYCDAIYKCDENGVMTCLWEKLAGKHLVKKLYTRIIAIRYINGITYALIAIYGSSSYSGYYCWVAYYDEKNNRWIAVYKIEYAHDYIINGTSKGLIIGRFYYEKKYYNFKGYLFSEIDNSNLDDMNFISLTDNSFLGDEETCFMYPDFSGEITSTGSSNKYSHGMSEKNGFYKIKQNNTAITEYRNYNGEVIKEYGNASFMPSFIISETPYAIGTSSSGFSSGGYYHSVSYPCYRDAYGNVILELSDDEKANIFGDNYVNRISFPLYYAYKEKFEVKIRQIVQNFIIEDGYIIYALATREYKLNDDGSENATGLFYYILKFDGNKTEKICRIQISDNHNGMPEPMGLLKTGDVYVAYLSYLNVSRIAYGTINNIRMIEKTFNNRQPGGAMIIDGELHLLLRDNSNVYYDNLIKIDASETIASANIPVFAWEE